MKLNDYNHTPKFSFNRNFWGKTNIITSISEFNKIAKFAFNLGEIELTNGGHLPKLDFIPEGGFWIHQPSLTNKLSSVEFGLVYNARIYRFTFRPSLETDEVGYTGLDAIKEFRKSCREELRKFAIIDNAEVAKIKETIPSVMIKLTPFGEMLRDVELENVVHIDINSAFPAGVVAKHPEFKEFFNRHYELRHTDSIHKAVMNYAIGASQSLKIRGERYPELARDAIAWTNAELLRLTKNLEKQSYNVIAYNTDGIFYMKEPNMPLYTDKNEGLGLGQWKTDGVFDKIRFKSAGSYEYIKGGKYHPVVRGATRLDRIKPRSEWHWGDIYQAVNVAYILKDNQVMEVSDGKEA